jgi:hypothetical protein
LLQMLSSIFFSFFSKGESMISKSLSIQAKYHLFYLILSYLFTQGCSSTLYRY